MNPKYWKGPYPPQHPEHHRVENFGIGLRSEKSDKTIKEYLDSEEYQEFIENRG